LSPSETLFLAGSGRLLVECSPETASRHQREKRGEERRERPELHVILVKDFARRLDGQWSDGADGQGASPPSDFDLRDSKHLRFA
jgi:hypothetical protein